MRDVRGFTLIELILVIVIIGIIAAAGAPVMVSSLTAYDTSLQTGVALDRLRYASERMAREFREATAGSFNMSTSAPQFTRSEYLVGSVTTLHCASCTVTIGQGSGQVTLTYDTPVVSTTPVLTNNLSSLSFAYYDQFGASTASATAVRYVEINLALLVNGQTYSQRTRVALRNF